MTYRILTKRLRKLGCEFVRQAPGSHEIWWNPEKKLFTTVPNRGSKDIPKGTLAAILRDLGLTRKDLDKA
ncbi:MAG: type II toxin-antitoxin system HicA family toxin [Dehalococcoidia bacterium]